MKATYSLQPSELIFPSQAPFSWTLRWARKHRAETPKVAARTYRIEGSARSADELSAAIAFAEKHDARLELD